MKWSLTGLIVLGWALALVWGSAGSDATQVEVTQLDASNWEEFVPKGKEVDAIYGDYVLRNQHLTAVIAEPLATRNANMTVRTVAGALIDLTTRDEPSDQLSAYYPGRRLYPFREAAVSDSTGQSVTLQAGQVVRGSQGAVTVRAAAAEGRPSVEVTYELEQNARWLTVRTRYHNPSDKPMTLVVEDDIRADGGKEWMSKAPNGQSNLYWIHDRYWGQAYGVYVADGQLQHNSDSRNSVLKYLAGEGGTVELTPGQSFEWQRRVYPARNLVEVKSIAAGFRGESAYPVRLLVRDQANRNLERTEVEVRNGQQVLGTGVTDDAGELTCSLPVGKYTIRLTHQGVALKPSLPVEVQPREQIQEFTLQPEFVPGHVSVTVTDESGMPLPCKLDFAPADGTPLPDFGPETAEFAVKNLYYAHDGKCSLSLAPGRYSLLISRGPEFDAIDRDLTVEAAQTTRVTASLRRSVHTPGWISADFHSHSSPSGDNTGSQLGRVLNLVCEHVEFAPCTEHNRVSTYDGHISSLGIGRFLATVSGMELTGQPLPLNHQNVFPMVHRPHTQDGGGPVTDVSPERQVERIASWDNHSEKLIQQNHPDIGWLFYDADGNGVPDAGHERSMALLDVMEIHPIHNALDLSPFETLDGRKGNNRVFNWLQLLNQGYRIYGVVNTDAHYNYHGSSSLRNWIQSPTDEPAEIDPMDVVHASEEGRLIMSNGPYLEVSLTPAGRETQVVPGQEVVIPRGRAMLHVRVQCANWLDIDRVQVLFNGRIAPQFNFTRETHPQLFSDEVVKFDRQLDLQLTGDTHIVVIAGHRGRTLGRVVGEGFWGQAEPAAMSNPIFVDIDQNGFTANGDTLDHPLPVKFGTRDK